MLITPIDLLLVFAGLAIMGVGVWRRPAARPPAPPPPGSVGELLLTGLALITAAVGPNILVLALTPGMPSMPALTRWVLLPSMVLLAIVWWVAWRRGYTRLQNRLWTGLWVGASTTAALDVFRLMSFSLGLLPGNMPRMFGVLILDTMALGPSPVSDVVGALYHVWISACFGLTSALLCGRTRWWGGVIWGLMIEVGMMVTPPMVIAMDTGYFGLKLGQGIVNGVFIGSFIPHLSYGIALGLLLERYTRHVGPLPRLISDTLTPRGRAPWVPGQAPGVREKGAHNANKTRGSRLAP